jgi:hypothetical protein
VGRVKKGTTTMQRFMAKVKVSPSGCWEWTATRTRDGYGQFYFEGRMWGAHRWAWMQKHGPVPEGFELDHFACDKPGCVNPDHVRPVKHRENTLRGDTVPARHLAKTACPRCKQPYDSHDSGRRCTRCRNEGQRRRYRERVA